MYDKIKLKYDSDNKGNMRRLPHSLNECLLSAWGIIREIRLEWRTI